MIIQEHNVITRPLMYAMESVGKYWEKNGFRPREVLKKAWIELLRCGCSQISRWTLCTPAMFYFLTLLERSDRADVLLEIPHVLQERNYTEQRIKDVLQDLEKIFQNVPFPGDKRSILARNRTQQLFCQNIPPIVDSRLDHPRFRQHSNMGRSNSEMRPARVGLQPR